MSAGTESVDPGVLEIATNDGPDDDPLAQSFDTGDQTADTPHDQFDPATRLRSQVELVDHFGVDERVHLHRDVTRGPFLGLCADQLRQTGSGREGTDQQFAVLALLGVAGEEVEQVGQIGAYRGVSCEDSDVLVDAGGRVVVVAGAYVGIACDGVAFVPDYQRDLRVRLEADNPVDDMNARIFQFLGPLDVPFLVEAGLELHESHHLLAFIGSLHESPHDRTVLRSAIESDLYRQDLGIAGGLTEELDDGRREGPIRVVDEDIAGLDRRKKVGSITSPHRQPGLRGPIPPFPRQIRPRQFCDHGKPG